MGSFLLLHVSQLSHLCPFTHPIISVIACVTTITSLQNQERLLVWLWFWDLHWEERWESFPSFWSPAYAYSTADSKDCKWNYKHACIHIFLRIETKSLMTCCSYCFVRVITACLHANHIIAIVKLLAVFIEYVEGRHRTILGMLLLIRVRHMSTHSHSDIWLQSLNCLI